MLTTIFSYFANDPLKLLYLFGGTGGLWFWYDKWTSRIRVEFEILRETYNPIDYDCDVVLQIRCRNIGSKLTSIAKGVEVFGVFGSQAGYLFSRVLEIEGTRLSLPVHETIDFVAKGRVPVSYCFPKIKKYTLRTTIGSNSSRFYAYNPDREMGRFSWYVKRLVLFFSKNRPVRA